MATISPHAFTTEEERAAELDEAFGGNVSPVQGFKPVRRVTALIVDILRRANNFFITGARGIEAIGIEPKKLKLILSPVIDGEPNPEFDPVKATACLPKIAEVIGLLTCDESEMDKCDDDIKHLGSVKREVMKRYTMGEILNALPDVQAEFDKINRSTAVVESDDVSTVKDGKKKRNPASVRRM